ncbi:MAG TPA: alpha/beta fold hydrolase, partial [Methylomirabilota bacterium]
MDRIAVGSVTLAVEQWPGPVPAPAGSAIVCIHGLTANHVCWASVADVLSPAHRLIAYDLRGRGESDKPARGYSLAHHGEDLEGLLDHFGLRKAVLIGHSLGAHIALRFAATRPARVSKLVLVDGGLDVRAEVLDSLRPAINRLGVEFPSLDAFLGFIRMLPMFEGRWNDYLERYFRYDVEALPGGAVRSKAARHAIE